VENVKLQNTECYTSK